MRQIDDYRAIHGWFMGHAAAGGPLQIAHKRGNRDAEARHLHRTAHEYFLVLAGTAVLEVAGVDLALGPGALVQVEPGEVHLLKEKSADLELLLLMDRYAENDKQLISGAEAEPSAPLR